MNKLYFLIIMFYTCLFQSIKAQEFINGDLSGIILGYSSLPTNWSKVQYNDINCLASQIGYDAPDLTSFNQPDSALGIMGNPYSGNTFVSGNFIFNPENGACLQEGIKQTVSGFIPGNIYSINFHQAVVKQSNLLDSSGSWAVYFDTTLIGISTPTFSDATFNSTEFNWELRTLLFEATATFHLIKFLPKDDDSLSSSITGTGLRMGIDCIFLSQGCEIENTGIDNLDAEKETVLFPNPFTDIFNISSNINEQLEVTLFDITSRKIFNQLFNNSTSINTAHYVKGIYLYEVRTKNEVIKKGKIIKD